MTMEIKNINDIQNYLIICNNVKEVKESFETLERLGLQVVNFRRVGFFAYAERDLIIENSFGIFKNHHSLNLLETCHKTVISFYNFKKQAKKLIPVIQDIEYNEEDGRVTKINNCKGQSVFIIGVGESVFFDGLLKSPCLVKFYKKNIELGEVYINEEMCKKAENKLIIETKLKNIAIRLNDGINISWSDIYQNKYYIYYSFANNKLDYEYYTSCKNQGSIYCLSDKFLEECKKEIGENELVKYFKE